jgi:hypothetical protein
MKLGGLHKWWYGTVRNAAELKRAANVCHFGPKTIPFCCHFACHFAPKAKWQNGRVREMGNARMRGMHLEREWYHVKAAAVLVRFMCFVRGQSAGGSS